MRIAPLQPALYEKWDAFVLKHDSGWWWHSTQWIRYALAHSGGTDLSHCILDDEGCIHGICVLIREGDRLSMGGDPLPFPIGIVPDFEERIAVRFRSSPLAARDTDMIGDMIRSGYNIGGWDSQVINLTQTEAQLHACLRKSYTSLVNKGRRCYRIVEVQSIRPLMYLHRECAGRETRPEATWLMMEAWSHVGHGLILLAEQDTAAGMITVAGAYFILYKGGAYYASSAHKPEATNAMHALIWTAMLRLKERGVERLELGWQERTGDTEKDKGIALFKRGFGGSPQRILVLER